MKPSSRDSDTTVVEFPQPRPGSESDFERKWGKKVAAYGYTIVPSVLLRGQHRLGVTPLQFNIIMQLLDCWWRAGDHPRPPKIEVATRIGIHPRTISKNVRELETAGLIKRIGRRSMFGDWHANEYDFRGLAAKLKEIEPELTTAKQTKRDLRRAAETPKGRRSRK